MSRPSPRTSVTARAPSRAWLFAAIFVGVFVIYWPALRGTLLWDDAGHVTRADLQSLSGLWRIWFQIGATQQYYPLLHSAFWLQHHLWGDATLGYHVVNVLLHATNACFLIVLLRRLAIPYAWLAGLIFAFHPVAVESVAWISELKNTLSAFFYACAALAYFRYRDERSMKRYVLASALFVCALLTKTVTATLPAALLVIFWWQQGRLNARRDFFPLIPWFLLGASSGVVTAWFEKTIIGASGAHFELGLIERVLLATRVPWFYLGKLLWPASLTFIYPRWVLDVTSGWQWSFPVATLTLLLALTWLAVRRPPEHAGASLSPTVNRAPLAAALIFGGSLFPVLGFLHVFPFLYSFVADHFQYLASAAVITFLAAAFGTLAKRIHPGISRGISTVLVLVLGGLTWKHAHAYRDVFTLWQDTIEKNPACWMAYNNLGIAHADAGRFEQAAALHRTALSLRPVYAEGENNLGYALSNAGRYQESLAHFERAIELQPKYAVAYNNLGIAFMMLKRNPEGLEAFRTALQYDPRYAGAHFNLGLALARSGNTPQAIVHFRRALEVNPNYAEAELNLGIGLMLTGKFEEAVPHFERSLVLNPASAEAHFLYARALAQHARPDDAISHYRQGLQIKSSSQALMEFAQMLQQAGRNEEARMRFLEAQQGAAGRN